MFVGKARASISLFRIAEATFITALVLVLTGCQQSQQEAQSRVAKKAKATISKPIASKGAEDLVLTKEIVGIKPAIFSVNYHKDKNPICTLEISEGGKIVSENRNLIECGLLTSRDMVDLKISGDVKGVTVFQQKEKQNNTFVLKRNLAGRWVVTEVVFVFPQDNMQTGDTDVVREAGTLSPPVLVSEYDRKNVEKSLFKSILQ
jgi:hypothetical protein